MRFKSVGLLLLTVLIFISCKERKNKTSNVLPKNKKVYNLCLDTAAIASAEIVVAKEFPKDDTAKILFYKNSLEPYYSFVREDGTLTDIKLQRIIVSDIDLDSLIHIFRPTNKPVEEFGTTCDCTSDFNRIIVFYNKSHDPLYIIQLSFLFDLVSFYPENIADCLYEFPNINKFERMKELSRFFKKYGIYVENDIVRNYSGE